MGVVSLSEIDRLQASQRSVARLALADLDRFWRRYNSLPADELRDALLQFMPAVAEKYGDVAAVAASDWYEAAKLKATGESARAVLGEVDREAIISSTRWAAGDLYGENRIAAWHKLRASLERQVKNVGRSTVQRSARRDGYSYARVPSGAETCAFCSMLASRGFVYGSAERAGSIDRFHDECDCQIVPDFAFSAAERAEHEAFVEKEFEAYRVGREVAKSDSEQDILAAMRQAHPGRFTDSKAVRPDATPSEAVWKHILFGDETGGGHLYGSLGSGKTQFPAGWSKARIEAAISQTVAKGKRRAAGDKERFELLVDDVLIRVAFRGGELMTAYPLRGVGVDVLTQSARVAVPLQSRDRRRYSG